MSTKHIYPIITYREAPFFIVTLWLMHDMPRWEYSLEEYIFFAVLYCSSEMKNQAFEFRNVKKGVPLYVVMRYMQIVNQ